VAADVRVSMPSLKSVDAVVRTVRPATRNVSAAVAGGSASIAPLISTSVLPGCPGPCPPDAGRDAGGTAGGRHTAEGPVDADGSVGLPLPPHAAASAHTMTTMTNGRRMETSS